MYTVSIHVKVFLAHGNVNAPFVGKTFENTKGVTSRFRLWVGTLYALMNIKDFLVMPTQLFIGQKFDDPTFLNHF